VCQLKGLVLRIIFCLLPFNLLNEDDENCVNYLNTNVVLAETTPFPVFEFLAHLAAMEGHLDCLGFLVKHITGMCVAMHDFTQWHPVFSIRNNFGHSPLTLARYYHKQAVIKYIEEEELDRMDASVNNEEGRLLI
jgi:hypothetical protein